MLVEVVSDVGVNDKEGVGGGGVGGGGVGGGGVGGGSVAFGGGQWCYC